MKDETGKAAVNAEREQALSASEVSTACGRDDEHSPPASAEDQLVRDGRRYSVANQRGKARARFRYIESNHPQKGCRFF